MDRPHHVLGSRTLWTGVLGFATSAFTACSQRSLAGPNGTLLDNLWALLLLAVGLLFAAVRWLKWRRWRLMVAIIGTEVLGNLANTLAGHDAQGVASVTIAGALLPSVTRPSGRRISREI